MELIADASFDLGGRALRAGDRFETDSIPGHILIFLRKAHKAPEVSTEQKPERPRRRKTYDRRDMTAESPSQNPEE